MNIFNSFFLCTVCFFYVHTQYITNDVTKEYLNQVMEVVWEQFMEYGISNLPDEDVTVSYSSPKEGHYYGYKLDGNLSLEDGFAVSLDAIKGYSKEAAATVSSLAVLIKNEMYFINLKIVRDFRFVVNDTIKLADPLRGVLIINPKIFSFYYTISKNLTTMEISTDVRSVHQQLGKDRLFFNPDNGLTQRLRKSWAPMWDSQITNGMATKWQPIFAKFLKKAVKEVKFPPLTFPVTR